MNVTSNTSPPARWFSPRGRPLPDNTPAGRRETRTGVVPRSLGPTARASRDILLRGWSVGVVPLELVDEPVKGVHVQPPPARPPQLLELDALLAVVGGAGVDDVPRHGGAARRPAYLGQPLLDL